MAVLFIDGFDHYGMYPSGATPSSVDFYRKWTGYIGNPPNSFGHGQEQDIDVVWARSPNGQGFRGGASRIFYKALGANYTEGVIGAAFYFEAFPIDSVVLAFIDGTEQLSVRGDGAGKLTISRAGTTLETSTNSISTNTWYYLEFKAKIDNSTGQYELRVNGTSTGWIPQSTANKDTQATAHAYWNACGFGTPSTLRMDDYYCLDCSAGTNTDFLGAVQVATLRPSHPGYYAQWSPNAGPNFTNVGEALPDGDVTFNSSGTANQIDSFDFNDLPAGTGSVFAIQHVISARQDVGTQRTIVPFQRSSSTDYASSTSLNTSSTYAMLREVLDENPDTSSAWDVSGLNDAEFGYKITV